jgi:hypothetical protein
MYYRGIKHTPEDVAKEQKVVSAGIYRGIKHDAITVKSSKVAKKAQGGIYRGVKHV